MLSARLALCFVSLMVYLYLRRLEFEDLFGIKIQVVKVKVHSV